MSRPIALSADIAQIGKRVSDTKKRFTWKFKIGTSSYQVELVSSAISGKRIVHINSREVYSEQNRLNINFDFSHTLDGHILRILKANQGVNNFSLRIDNIDFDDLTQGKSYLFKQRPQAKQQQQVDPFSQFASFANKKTEIKSKNDFGEFDFDNFISQTKSESQIPKKKLNSFQNNEDKNNNFNIHQTNIFQQDAFQTNSFNNFQNNFKNQQKNLIDINPFETNAYNVTNMYADLRKQDDPFSQLWSSNMIDNTQKSKISAKQVVNKVKMTVQKTKQKIMDSLI